MKSTITELNQKEIIKISGGKLEDKKNNILLGLYAISPFAGFALAIGGYLFLTTPKRIAD